MSEQFTIEQKPLDRARFLTAEDLQRLGGFARYRDVDGDAIGWRDAAWDARHPKAAYFTRGSDTTMARIHDEGRPGRVRRSDGAAVRGNLRMRASWFRRR